MTSWVAYAPRRARDVREWLSAKGITTRAGLDAVLRELGIDPSTFPEDAVRDHLSSAEETRAAKAPEITGAQEKVDPAPAGTLQAAPVKQKRGPRSSEPS